VDIPSYSTYISMGNLLNLSDLITYFETHIHRPLNAAPMVRPLCFEYIDQDKLDILTKQFNAYSPTPTIHNQQQRPPAQRPPAQRQRPPILRPPIQPAHQIRPPIQPHNKYNNQYTNHYSNHHNH